MFVRGDRLDCGECGIGGDFEVIQSADGYRAEFGESLSGILCGARCSVTVRCGYMEIGTAVIAEVRCHPKRSDKGHIGYMIGHKS